MAQTRVYHRSFAGGELSPEMFGRIDDVKFQTGTALMRNFVALPQGPAENRAGTQYVNEVKDSSKRTRLIPFTFSVTQTMVIEVGAGYFRFHTLGGTLTDGAPLAYNALTTYVLGDRVLSGGVVYYCLQTTTGNAPPNATFWYPMPSGIYEIPNPYAEADLFDLHYVQSGDVLTIVHPNYAPRELRRLAVRRWTITAISFGAGIAPPTAVTATGTPGYTLTITAITQANPAVITTNTNHGLAAFDSVYINSIQGMTQFGAGFYIVNTAPATNTLTVKRVDTGAIVDSSTWSAYVAGTGRIQLAAQTSDIIGKYVVTSISSVNLDESVPSIEAQVVNNLNVAGSYNTITWNAVVGAVRYNVYKLQSGLYGYIGQAEGTSFTDTNIAPDLGRTPPIFDTSFTGGAITSVPVTFGGSGYGSSLPSGSSGTFSNIAVIAGGSGYNTPSLTVTDPTGTGASFTVNTTGSSLNRVISSITINNGGSNYTSPVFTLNDNFSGTNPPGNGAILAATLLPYEPPDLSQTVTLSVSDPTGVGAVLQPVVAGGVITGVNVINGGYGYTNPTVTVSVSLGGSGATFGTPTLTSPQYPGAVSYFEQRRVFAGTNAAPQTLWMTRTGTESDLSYSIPTQDTDRILFRVAAREANTIRHLVPLTQLLALTSAAEWRISPVNSDTITPTTISVRPQSYVGSNNVQPSIVNNTVVYCSARDGHVRELGYSWQASGFVTGDLALRSAHLFDDYELVDMCYSKAPHPILWFISTSGKLLGLTYIPEQQIGAWHQHDTDGTFESCTAVAEGAEDRLYVIVKRTINGVTKRYVERFASRQYSRLADAFHVDSGLTYDGTNTTATTVTVSGGSTWGPSDSLTITASAATFQFPATTDVGDCIVLTGSDGTQYRLEITATSSTTVATAKVDKVIPAALRNTPTAVWAWARDTVSGLGHLEGKTVSILGDGAVMPQQVVTGGSVTLQRPSTVIHVGLPFLSDLQTLPMTLQMEAFGQGRAKNINEAFLRVYRSSGIFIGPDADNLTEAKLRTMEPYGSPPSLKTEEIGVKITPAWKQSGQVFVRQVDPLPLNLVGLTLEVSIGG